MSVAGNVATAAKPQPPPLPRFVDNGDGTITDNQTGLMWEKKIAPTGYPSSVDNTYSWSCSGGSCTGLDPDGTLFTDFLPRMNCAISADGTCPVNGKYRDWRIPTIAELRTLFDFGFASCIDPIFGPTAASTYWASSLFGSSYPAFAWGVRFCGGTDSPLKTDTASARAVRGGS